MHGPTLSQSNQHQDDCGAYSVRQNLCSVKSDMSAFDLSALCQGTKNGFVKFCKAHEQRLRLNLHDFRMIRADAEESDTYINVG